MIKAIETQYKGYRFRSRLEARWAVFFDALGAKWEYEAEGYEMSDGSRYLPDFWLPEFKCWFEVKGEACSADDEAKIDLFRSEKNASVIVAQGPIPHTVWDFSRDCEHQWGGVPRNCDDRTMPKDDINAMFSGEDNYCKSFGVHVLCPLCQEEYVHFSGVEEKDGEDYTNWDGRGKSLAVHMSCENGHTWDFRLGFHKGYTFANITNVCREEKNILIALAGFNEIKGNDALKAARSARFEHGEKPL